MAPLYGQALPVSSDQVFIFRQLVASVAQCEKLGSHAWSLTQLDDGFRLNVGQVEVLTCRFSFWLDGEPDLSRDATLVTFRMLLAGEGCLNAIDLLQAAADIYEMSYVPVGEKHWCYEGRFYAGIDGATEPSRAVVEDQVAALRSFHHAFLNLACHTPTGKLRQKSTFARSHCPALYEYALNVVGNSGKSVEANGVDGAEGGGVNTLMRIRIEKAGADAGFELAPTWSGNRASLRSVQFPESIFVKLEGDEAFLVTSSNPDVMPSGASAATLRVEGWQELYDTLGKIAATARTLPDRVAQQFAKKTASMPKFTVAERWTVQRVGQGIFRKALLDLWRGQCCVTGLALPELLRASHIKPWAACESDDERLDAFNGLLLSPNLDVLFDGGWISVTDDGGILVSPALSESVQIAIGFSMDWKVTGLLPKHAPYLSYHRKHVWRSEGVAHSNGDTNA